MSKRRKQVSSTTIMIGGVTVNGRKVAGINYRRVEYDDGTVEESGGTPEQFLSNLLEADDAPKKQKGKRR